MADCVFVEFGVGAWSFPAYPSWPSSYEMYIGGNGPVYGYLLQTTTPASGITHYTCSEGWMLALTPTEFGGLWSQVDTLWSNYVTAVGSNSSLSSQVSSLSASLNTANYQLSQSQAQVASLTLQLANANNQLASDAAIIALQTGSSGGTSGTGGNSAFDLTPADAGTIAVAIAVVWALAWGIRQMVRVLKAGDSEESSD